MLPTLLRPLTTVTRLLSDDRSCDIRRDAATCSHSVHTDLVPGILMGYPDRIRPRMVLSQLVVRHHVSRPLSYFHWRFCSLDPWSVKMLNGWIMIKLCPLCVWVWWRGSTLSHVTRHAVTSHASRGRGLIHLLGNKGKWGKNGHFGEHWPLQSPLSNHEYY